MAIRHTATTVAIHTDGRTTGIHIDGRTTGIHINARITDIRIGVMSCTDIKSGSADPSDENKAPDTFRGFKFVTRVRLHLEKLHNTFGKSGHRAPHWSLILCADFFGQSAVISSSQSTSLASRPRLLINRERP
jgi:hypothetical protein